LFNKKDIIIVKKKINLLNFNSDKKKIKFKKKNTYFLGPWSKSNINLFDEKFNDTLNFNKTFNIKKYSSDVKFLIKKYEFTLKILTFELNKIHKTNHSQKYWELLLCRWLMTWINHTYFIWDYVKKINRKFEVLNVYQNKFDSKSFIPEDTWDSHLMCRANSNSWREWTFGEILKNSSKNKINFVDIDKKKSFLKKTNYSLLAPNLFFLRKNPKIFFYKLELNKKIKLNLFKKFKFAFLKYSEKRIYFNKNNIINRNLLENLNSSIKTECSFQKLLMAQIKHSLPKIFYENYSELKEINKKINWPEKTKYLLTSYGGVYDEPFKLFCAENEYLNKSQKLCVLQHGYGNFFKCDDFYNIYLDRRVSDIYLTWGKKIKNNSVPFFYPKYIKKKSSFKYDVKKNILFLTYSFNSGLIFPVDSFKNGNIINYESARKILNFNKRIDNNLNKRIFFKNLNMNLRNDFEKSLKSKIPSIKFYKKNIKLIEIIDNYNLFIHHFLGTPFFECMSFNKPSIIIFDEKNSFPLDDEFKKFLVKFHKLKILFYDEKKAADFINKNFSKLEEWWNTKELQLTIKKFSELYCFNPTDPMKIISKIFK